MRRLQAVRRKQALIEIDKEACDSIALLIKSKRIPIDSEETYLADFSPREVGNFYFCLVAICHQTSPRGKPTLEGYVSGVYRKGWDYLTAKLEAAAHYDLTLVTPSKWSEITEAEMRVIFYDSQYGNRLTEPGNRAALVRDLGRVMLENNWKWIEELYHLCDGRVATENPNLIELLANFKAYQDPVKKKSYFFLSIMRNSGLWHFVDPERLGPPVDYHEMRGHLRLGTVVVNDDTLRQKLFANTPLTAAEDIALRQSVHDAILLISHLSGLRNPSQLHYLFWNVFRSCCSRETPHCLGCPPDCPLPERYIHLANQPTGERRCPFTEMCANTCATEHQRYLEPVVDTEYY